jgi:hypothetical protein
MHGWNFCLSSVCAAILCCLNLWVGFEDFSLSLCDHYAFDVQVGILFSNQIILNNALRACTQHCCWCHFWVEKLMDERGKRCEAFIDAAFILVFHSFFWSLQVTCTTLSHFFLSLSLSLSLSFLTRSTGSRIQPISAHLRGKVMYQQMKVRGKEQELSGIKLLNFFPLVCP